MSLLDFKWMPQPIIEEEDEQEVATRSSKNRKSRTNLQMGSEIGSGLDPLKEFKKLEKKFASRKKA